MDVLEPAHGAQLDDALDSQHQFISATALLVNHVRQERSLSSWPCLFHLSNNKYQTVELVQVNDIYQQTFNEINFTKELIMTVYKTNHHMISTHAMVSFALLCMAEFIKDSTVLWLLHGATVSFHKPQSEQEQQHHDDITNHKKIHHHH